MIIGLILLIVVAWPQTLDLMLYNATEKCVFVCVCFFLLHVHGVQCKSKVAFCVSSSHLDGYTVIQ